MAFGLCRSERWSLRHADFDQVLEESPRKIGKLDLGFRRHLQSQSQFESKFRGQIRRCDALDLHQPAKTPQVVAIIFQCYRLVVLGGETFFE